VVLSTFPDASRVIDVVFLDKVSTTEFDLKIDMAPKSPPKSMTQKTWIMNDGTSDIGETPAQFLLIRNLDTMLQEENIAKGLMKLESEPKRILLIRDRKTKVSWGYAFVEYRDVSVCPLLLTYSSWLKPPLKSTKGTSHSK
jgi:RNA recognition motif-containing protein